MMLVWTDLETTGLTPSCSEILEVSMHFADFYDPWNLENVFYPKPYHAVVHFPRSHVGSLDPFIVGMHTKNGLLEECHNSTKQLVHVAEDLLKLIPEERDREERPILAGSTVGFDKSFLEHHMPSVARRFSHRVFDVSSIKLFCRALGLEKFPKAEAHRAGDDIRESVAHGKACANWLKNGAVVTDPKHPDFKGQLTPGDAP